MEGIGPESILFDVEVVDVSLWAISGSGVDTSFSITGMNDGTVVTSTLVAAGPGEYVELSLSSTTGFDTIIFEEVGNSSVYAFDDLSFTTVPEPGSVTLLLFMTLITRSRRRRS